MFNCKRYEKLSFSDYVTEIMKDQPVTQIPIPSKQKTYNVMHFTDIHVDLTYTVGNNAACD